MTALIVIAIIVVLLVIYVISVYNSFIRLTHQAKEAEAGIDAHLKQRFDLIPNLVETVKGYARHESSTLDAVIRARNAGLNANGPAEKSAADNQLSGALKNLFALSEAYPDLKADSSFLDLQRQLEEIEKALLNARKYYNAIVRDFNTRISVFPSSIIASFGHFSPLSYVEVDEAEKSNVKVSF